MDVILIKDMPGLGFKNEIVNREKEFIRKGGSLIFPLPKIQIINNKKS